MSSPISNGLFGVPWGIGGGQAVLQAETARFFANLVTAGQEGVMGKDHLTPQQLAVPGAGIQLLPGGMSIVNRTPGVQSQTYLGLAASAITVNLDPTTGTSRSDMVMIRVEDPYVSGNSWPVPTDVADGPYIKPFVQYGVSSSIQTVGALGFNWSAIPIAMVTRPPSTSTIVNSQIMDLRVLVNPLNGIEPAANAYGERIELTNIATGTGTIASPGDILQPSDSSFKDYPVSANWTVQVPTWATYLELVINFYNAKVETGSFWGYIHPVIAGVAQSDLSIDTDAPSVGGTDKNFFCGGNYYINPALRGTQITIKTQAKSNGETGVLKIYQYSYIVAHFKFKQVPGVA